jgi:hypothetical protein
MPTLPYAMSRDLPLTHDMDVVVVGGGPGGLGAAVFAARAGAKTLLIERYGFLGGMASAGEVQPFMWNHARGVALDKPVYLEWVQRMQGYLPAALQQPDDREAGTYATHIIEKDLAMLAMEDLCLEAGVTLLYHHWLADAVREGREIAGLVLHSKSGLTAVRGKCYVDCTGDADLAALAGCAFEIGGPTGHCQPMTLCFKLSHVDRTQMPDQRTLNALYEAAKARGEIDCPRENVLHFGCHTPDLVHFNTTRVIQHDATDGAQLSAAEIIARGQVRQYLAWLRREVPGFAQAQLHSMAHHIGVRESRRVTGLAYLTREAFLAREKFPDAIARVSYPIDIHNPTGKGTEIVHMPDGEYYEVPFGCVVPADIDNLTVGGRPISVDHAIHSSLRVMPPACTIGQAAGLAAALAAQRGCRPAELDGIEVRTHLVAMGANL